MRFGRTFPVPHKQQHALVNPSGSATNAASDTSFTADYATAYYSVILVALDTVLSSDTAIVGLGVAPPPPVPPPTPYFPQPTLHGLSAQFLTTVATDHRWLISVQVWNGNEFLEDISQYVTAGSVSVDETAEIRRTCTLTVAGVPSLIPENLGDLLHPASSNELHIARGVRYSNGTTELAQLGVFRMTKPVINDDDVTPTITVNGQDRASVIARIAWQAPYPIAAGTNIAAAIQAAMESRYAGLTYNFANITFAYAAQTFGADMVAGSGGSSDPMQDLITFAAAAGCELFFDVYGVATLREIINPTTSQIIDQVHFVEGQNCTMTTVTRTLDESTAYNGVIVYCNGTGPALPFVTTLWDVNPGSPTYYLGPWGQVPYIITTTTIPSATQTLLQAQAAAEAYAFGQLQLILGAFDNVSLTTVPNPALREGDCVEVTRGRVRINANYVISTMTIPLDPLTEMDITFRPRISTS